MIGAKTRQRYSPTIYEVLVLCAIRKCGNLDVDVASIQSAFDRYAHTTLTTSTAHMVLKRMYAQGLVAVRREKRGKGESFVFYTLTEEGVAALAVWLDAIVEMI